MLRPTTTLPSPALILASVHARDGMVITESVKDNARINKDKFFIVLS
jgi:hypothetical protein